MSAFLFLVRSQSKTFNFTVLCCVIQQNFQLYYSVLHHKEKLLILQFFAGSQGKTVSCWVTKQTMSTILILGHGGVLIYIGVRPSHFKLLSRCRLKIERMPPQHQADTSKNTSHVLEYGPNKIPANTASSKATRLFVMEE